MVESSLPFFSIIIPTYRRPKRLAACLQSIARLDYPRDQFEVIVVDDGSPTPMQTVVADFSGQLEVMLIKQAHAGPATARNTGAAKAKGEILAFTDDDCEPAVNWLKTLAIRFAKNSRSAVGGRTINALPQNIYSTTSQMLIDYLYDYYNADPLQARFLTSNNIALLTKCFRGIGGFDATFRRAAGEDRELCDRWFQNGYRMIYAKEVLVYHTHALSLRTFWKQHFNYGHGASHFHHARKLRGQRRIGLEPPVFYSNLLRYPFLKSKSLPSLLLTTLLLVSQSANSIGFLLNRQSSS
jgi:glycosyltransferase involved in cell wall biosynthesis